MNVLNVTVLLDPVFGGGTAERTYQMSKALVHAGANCTILTTDVGLSEDRIGSLKGVKVVALHCIYKRFYVVQFSWAKLKELVSNVDIVHLMGHWNMLNILVYLVAKRTGTPYVICPAGELALFGRSRWLKKMFNAVVGYRLVQDAAGHIGVTSDEISFYQGYDIKEELITIIPNGVNESDFVVSEKANFSRKFGGKDVPFILFMGRLNAIKGPDLLLEAFLIIAHQFPSYHLVFAGPDGGLLEALQHRVSEGDMDDRVHFIGYVSGIDKASAYRDATFLAIPSRQEAMSIVVLEAGVSGTPVLLTDRCGFNEVATIGGGMVVKSTIAELANGMESMINEHANLSEMGGRLKFFVKSNYTWEIICQRYLALYNQITLQKNQMPEKE